MHSSDEKIVFNVEEASRILGISISQTYKMIQNNELPSVRMGRRILIPVKKLFRIIEE